MRQQHLPTVGDTVTIVRHIVARSGAVIDARPPADTAIATLVAPPVISREGDSVRVAYTVAVWTAGHSDLVFPGIVVVDLRGHVDTLADMRVPIDVASTLPTAKPAATLAPQAARPWLNRADRTLQPFVVLLPLALIGIGLLAWWWRRRGPAIAAVTPATAPAALTDARMDGWIAAGEARLALEHVNALVGDRADFAEWRGRVAVTRFAAGDDAIPAALAREAWDRLKPPSS